MKPYRWRTRSASNVYVDSLTGDDQGGDGTMGNPYKTLGKAYRGRSTAPGTIVCRGRFCEDMADGNHYTMIRGDYMGAAVFDGEDTFLIYGFGHTDMIIENCAPATYDLVVHTGSGSLAGVGRALSANHVGLDGTACPPAPAPTAPSGSSSASSKPKTATASPCASPYSTPTACAASTRLGTIARNCLIVSPPTPSHKSCRRRTKKMKRKEVREHETKRHKKNRYRINGNDL